MSAFTSITYHYNLGSTPARVNRLTGELQINVPVWDKLTPEAKRFVLYHEEGHYVLNTKNEIEADRYAFEKYAAEGYSLKAGVKALTQVLTNSPAHLQRAASVYGQARQFDHYNSNKMVNAEWYNATGKRQARQERKTARKDLRVQKKQDKATRKNERAAANNTQKVMLAQQGVSKGGMFAQGAGGIVSKVASIASSIAVPGLGGLLPAAAPGDNVAAPSAAEVAMSSGNNLSPVQNSIGSAGGYLPAPEVEELETVVAGTGSKSAGKNKYLPFIIGGALLLVVVLFFVFRKK